MLKRVYVVTKICDYEYGCTEIESIWKTFEEAQEHIKNDLQQETITLCPPNYAVVFKYGIEEYEVQGK